MSDARADPACSGATLDEEANFVAHVDAMELANLVAAPDSVQLSAPVGPWSLVGSSGGAVTTCATNITPPPPTWCGCAANACVDLDGL